jgi:hypothetical protein
MPYRYYNQILSRTVRGQDSADLFNSVDKWLNEYSVVGEVGAIKNYSLGGNVWNCWDILFKPYNAPDFQSFPGLNEIALIKIGVSLTPPFYNNKPLTRITITNGIPTNTNAWETPSVTGKYYNGVSPWDAYPPTLAYALGYSANDLLLSNLPENIYIYEGAYNFGIGIHANSNQAAFWRNGIKIYLSDSVPAQATWAANNGGRMNIVPNNLMVKYFNAVCNSLSRYSMTTAGGVPVILSGLGFQNSDAEIEEGGAGKPGTWNDDVHEIHFEGLQGQGTYKIYLTPHIAPEFVTDSNTQMTIASMPAMLAGTYQIKLRKLDSYHALGRHVDSYAGDWRCDTDGRVYAGQRIIFTVADDGDGDGEEDPVIYIEWPWKSRTTTIFKYWAPIDTRTPDIFFEGKILDISSFERSPSDISGLAQVSDLTIEIANHDQEISMLLAEYECLNQTVSFWWGFRNDPYAWKSYLCSMVVTDYEKPDSTWRVTLRDTNARYF